MNLSDLLEKQKYHLKLLEEINAKISNHPETIKTNIQNGLKFLNICLDNDNLSKLEPYLTNYHENIEVGFEDYRPPIKAEYMFYFDDVIICISASFSGCRENFEYDIDLRNGGSGQKFMDIFSEIDENKIYDHLYAY